MKYLVYIIILLLLIRCKKQEIGPQCPSCVTSIKSVSKTVLIGCEGNFGWGNASISLYDSEKKTVQQNLYQNVNGTVLGDVLQSFHLFQGKLYAVLNNSGKITILDTTDFTYQGEISGMTSPRYMLGLSTSKAYVTDLYSNDIYIVNPATQSIIGGIATNHWTEQIYQFDGPDKVYVCVMDTNWVFVIDPVSDVITDTIFVAKSPSGIVQDAQNKLWILCTGGISQELAKLYRFNITNQLIEQVFTFSNLSDSPNNLRINKSGTELYFLNGGFQSMATDAPSLPSGNVINSNSALFYGMNVNQSTADIYITDAIDYVQPGLVYRFDSLFNPLDTIQTGIIPQAIWFK